MDSSINSTQQIQQPIQKRTINRPNVGVVDVPKISSTPMKDELVKQAQENPREIINFKSNKKRNFNLQSALSAFITGGGITLLIGLIIKMKK